MSRRVARAAPPHGDLLRRFEAATLPAEEMTHENHVRLAWLFARRDSSPRAAVDLAEALRRYVSAAGAEARYHETVTLAFAFEVRRRVAEQPRAGGWPAFRERNGDLFTGARSWLRRLYGHDPFASALARRVFVLPRAKVPTMPRMRSRFR